MRSWRIRNWPECGKSGSGGIGQWGMRWNQGSSSFGWGENSPLAKMFREVPASPDMHILQRINTLLAVILNLSSPMLSTNKARCTSAGSAAPVGNTMNRLTSALA